MGNCVLKECGFHLNKNQQLKEKQFKQLMKSEYFSRMADDFDSVKEKASISKPPQIILQKPSDLPIEVPPPKILHPTPIKPLESSESINSKFKSPEFKFNKTEPGTFPSNEKSPVLDKNEKTPPNGYTEKNKSGQKTEDLRKSGASSDYKNGFQNKLFTHEIDSESEKAGGEDNFEQIFRDEQDSEEEELMEKMFPESFKKK